MTMVRVATLDKSNPRAESLKPCMLRSHTDVDVQIRDIAYSGAEGSFVSVCIDAGPTERPFSVTLSTSPDSALAGQ